MSKGHKETNTVSLKHGIAREFMERPPGGVLQATARGGPAVWGDPESGQQPSFQHLKGGDRSKQLWILVGLTWPGPGQ